MTNWVKYSGDRSVKRGMVKVGSDSDGSTLVVARCWNNNDLIPCKARPTQAIAFCANKNEEYIAYRFEVLMMDDYKWVPVKGGKIPDDAVVGGRTKEGEALYIGRTMHNGNAVAGKVEHHNGLLYYSYYYKEYISRKYEILVEED